MTKKFVFGAAALAVSALLMTPSASASCNPGKSATTFSTSTAYWVPLEAGGTLTGAAWQLGAPGSFRSDGGAVVCSDFLVETGGGLSLALDLGACGAGCPATGATLATLAQSSGPAGTSFLLATIVETPAATVNFDYATQGDHAMIAIPRPRVLSSAKNLGNPLLVDLNVALDSIAGGLYGPNAASAITGFRILGASASSDPGRDASAYTLRASVPAGGGTAATQALQVDCSNPNSDQWLVTQISFENGAVLSGAVSGATRVNCNPALANPKNPKVKVAPKVRAN
jgi:hypothetical protein